MKHLLWIFSLSSICFGYDINDLKNIQKMNMLPSMQVLHPHIINYHFHNSNGYLNNGFITVYTKDSIYSGLGTWKMKSKQKIFGKQIDLHNTSKITLNGLRFTPAQTDSVFFFDKKGLQDDKDWLFQQELGKISVFSTFPVSGHEKVSIHGGPIKKYKKKEISKLLEKFPLAYAHLDKDPLFAIRLYNNAIQSESYIKKNNISHKDFARAFFPQKSSSDDIYSLEKKPYDESKKLRKFHPNHYISRIARLHYLIALNSSKPMILKEIDKHIQHIRQMKPNFYMTHYVEARALYNKKKYKKALSKYYLALQYAPQNPILVEHYEKFIFDVENKVYEQEKKVATE